MVFFCIYSVWSSLGFLNLWVGISHWFHQYRKNSQLLLLCLEHWLCSILFISFLSRSPITHVLRLFSMSHTAIFLYSVPQFVYIYSSVILCSIVSNLMLNPSIESSSFPYYYFLKINLFIYGWVGSLLLHTGFLYLQWVGLLFVVVHGLLIAVASLVVALGARASVVVARGLSSCGTRA